MREIKGSAQDLNNDLDVAIKRPSGTWKERLAARVFVDAETGCHNWQGALSLGYGRMRGPGGRAATTHRLAYVLAVGPIPDGLQLDHLCRNRRCCNPAHLEPVTPLENVRRADGNARKTHCKRGHPLSGDNLYRDPSGLRRRCRTCTNRPVRS